MERRLATIFSADVAGYSRLMGLDEERTLDAFRICRGTIAGLVEKRRGRIFGEAGDSVIVEFASPVEAVRAAVEVQASLAGLALDLPDGLQMQFRIGINLGDVMVEAGNLYGDGVNVAARIESFARPGGIAVSGSVHDQVCDRAGLAFEDAGEQRLKNIERPVRIYNVVAVSDRAGAGRKGAAGPAKARPAAKDKPSIAVLPFDSISGAERWQRIADGIVEEIVTDLVRHGELSVIARPPAFAMEKSADLRAVGRALGAQYLVAGSIQAASGKIRLNVRLVDADYGTHLWAARLDRAEGDLFELEDAVVEAVAGSICGMEGAVVRAQLGRLGRKHPAALESFELFLLGLEREKTFVRESTFEAIDLLQRSLALHPDFARAWLILSYCWEHVAVAGWQDDIAGAQQHRRRAILKAAELDPHDPLVMIELGDVLFEDGNRAAAKAAFEQALAAGRTNADAMALIAKYVGGILGRPAEGRELIERALRLNPHAPGWYYMNKLRACYLAHDHEAGLAAVLNSPESPVTRLFAALCLAELGRGPEAGQAAAELKQRYPEFDPADIGREAWLNGADALDRFRQGLPRIGFRTAPG